MAQFCSSTLALQELRHRPKEVLEALSGYARRFRVTDSSPAELGAGGVYISDFVGGKNAGTGWVPARRSTQLWNRCFRTFALRLVN